MIIFDDIILIHEYLSFINECINRLNNSFFLCKGIDFFSCTLVTGLVERDEKLYYNDKCLAVASSDFYVLDNFSKGFVYFKTYKEGEFIRFSYHS